MSNVLSEDKRQQVLTLGRLGWSLRRTEEATSGRRETASAYLKAGGVAVRGRGRASSRPSELAMAADSTPVDVDRILNNCWNRSGTWSSRPRRSVPRPAEAMAPLGTLPRVGRFSRPELHSGASSSMPGIP